MKKAKVTVHPDYRISQVDKRLFGAFLEPIGSWVYGGIYNPKHPTADDIGFRRDIIDAVREFDLPALRFPGGNWISGWDWKDSIGPVENRKVNLDLAWFQIEPNIVGHDEYLEWTKRVGTEPMYTINLGTEDMKSAAHLVEYTRHSGGTYWSELRRKNGHPNPYPVKTWYLGNEMDGHWQIGSWEKDPVGFGIRTHEISKVVKWIDNKAETVFAGTSDHNRHFPEWEMAALEQCYESVDYISLHHYHSAPEGDIANYLNISSVFEDYINTSISICDYLQTKLRTPKKMYISFDEYGANFGKQGEVLFGRRGWQDVSKSYFQFASRDNVFTKYDPENFVESQYGTNHQMLNALAMASVLLTFLRHVDRVKIGCMTGGIRNALAFNGEHVWKNAAYYPFYQMNKMARDGISILPVVNGPTFNTEQFALTGSNQCPAYENVQAIEAAVVHQEEKDEVCIFLINRAVEDDIEISLDVRGFEGYKLTEHIEMYTEDMKRGNSFEHPELIKPTNNVDTKMENGRVIAIAKKLSWNVIRLKK
ncbi:alpha-L-arabinofuranosidase C-terminal domain-containing protein [Pseudogracilibacillus auburnensis]|uniref:alpha-L-arabinofuranosidase C-terminal domain-containing protein n=1 Tax=Pseudogracilibacillus auburnensis TaxID=1494959 RepID=UPI001A9686CC|nr:alpha-L-arabinofuranosidase C-terminal domain-containing protein [Pseudogracilibacillus auburnensis]MBO1005791.1 alpha-L-arabinofuranosidase [Pseudogracilibacillus auburnensis]